MITRKRAALALVLVGALLSGCVGVIDRCADGLNPPPGGWDRHAPT